MPPSYWNVLARKLNRYTIARGDFGIQCQISAHDLGPSAPDAPRPEMRKQDEGMKAVLSTSDRDRERVLFEQLATSHSKVHELEKALASAEGRDTELAGSAQEGE